MNINWQNTESYVLLNPKFSEKDCSRYNRLLPVTQEWPNHLWLSTSGSSVLKWVGLSKRAILASAEAVNYHLGSDTNDRWINPLPHFHVGGLGIWARAFLSGAKVFDYKREDSKKWQAAEYYSFLNEMKGTLTSLVPAQLFDLVKLKLHSPPSLRAVIIGGGVLLPTLYERAIELGWPILPSYGMTECASQVATASLSSLSRKEVPRLELLKHIQGKEENGLLSFSGSSLLSVYANFHDDDDEEIQFFDPKVNGWFTSEDRGLIQNRIVTLYGRVDQVIKIGGENVDLSRLELHLQTLLLKFSIRGDAVLVAVPDARLGHIIQLATDSMSREVVNVLVDEFQRSVLPFERIRKVHFLPHLPRSALGKILKKELISILV